MSKCFECGQKLPMHDANCSIKILGPTGKFPDSKISEDDEGEIQIAIGATEKEVIINFGAPVSWIGFEPDQAMEIANSIIVKAEAVKRLSK